MVIQKIKAFFTNKNSLLALFIDETGQGFFRKVYYEDNKFDLGSGMNARTYLVDKECTYWVKKKRSMLAVYDVNSPEPVDVLLKKDSVITSRSLSTIVKNKVVTDLFSPENDLQLRIAIYASVAAAILSLMILLIQFGVIKVTG